MIVLRNLEDDLKKLPPGGLVLAMGNFDGLHLGHRAVIGRAVDIAREKQLPSAVLTFKQHPRSVLFPESPPLLLLPPEEKVRRIEQLGVDMLVHLDFTTQLASLSAEEFARQILSEKLHAKQIVVGEDFHFGKERKGTPSMLQEVGRELGFTVTFVPPVQLGKCEVSSTQIRKLLGEGKVREAAVLLNRDYEIIGRVVRGDLRGRRLGFPTANLSAYNELIPKDGVYAVWAVHEGRRYAAMANIGKRPTFPGSVPTVEIHLLGFDGELYGEELSIHFIERIRPEKAFSSEEELIAQLHRDREKALDVLENRRESDVNSDNQ